MNRIYNNHSIRVLLLFICYCIGICCSQAQSLVMRKGTITLEIPEDPYEYCDDPNNTLCIDAVDRAIETYTPLVPHLNSVIIPQQFSTLYDNVFDILNNALYDELYLLIDLMEDIFICNFTKSGDDSYSYPIVDNNISATYRGIPTIEVIDGQKLYFSGTCRNAYAGAGTEREGFVHIIGKESESVDIYLDNFNIKTQSKTIPMPAEMKGGCIEGMCAPIAIGTDGESDGFTARFHIMGKNQLTGGQRTELLDESDNGIDKILAEILEVVSSPIAVRPVWKYEEGIDSYKNKKVTLTFDDLWPIDANDATKTKRTNGVLDLNVEGNLGTPSIDLGNDKGSCEFNGGQYILHTPRTNSMFYVCSMSICYKMTNLMGMSFYGMGSSASAVNTNDSQGSQDICEVRINDGTFTTHPALEDKNIVDVVTRGWYKDYSDLRLPYSSRINGGTFNNCEVYACDASAEPGMTPQNDDGDNLCRVSLKVEDSDIDPVLDTKLTPIENYGSQSLTPTEPDDNGERFVYLYQKGDCRSNEKYIRNWTTVIPLMGVKDMLTMGGDVKVESETLDGKDIENAYMLYARLNEYTKKYAGIDIMGIRPKPTISQAIGLGGNKEFSSITNESDYTIANGLYMMLSFKSNEWNTMVAPYDIANIYVLETTDTQKQPDETLEAFLQRQGEADGNLAQTIVTSLCPDIFSGKGSGVHMSLIDISRKQLGKEPFKLIPYSPEYDREGHGASKAHFYLYEQVSKFSDVDNYEEPTESDDEYWDILSGICKWNFPTTDAPLSDNWRLVTPKVMPIGTYTDQDGNTNTEPVEVWMKRGRTYSFFLPSDEDNYWDGKYLIFEGYGPQTLSGSGETGDFIVPSNFEDYGDDIDNIISQGNYTFANCSIPMTEQIFLPERRVENGIINYDFVRTEYSNDSEAANIILPGQVYVVLSEENTQKYEVITRNGQAKMIRRDNSIVSDEAYSSLPTIGSTLLKVYSDEQIVYIQSFAEQTISMYSIDGRQLWQGNLHDGDKRSLSVAPGVYLIKGQSESIKLIVK